MAEHTVRDNDMKLLLVYATRYAIGRQSTAPADVQAIVRQHVAALPRHARISLAKEIRDAPSLGHPTIDAPGWREFAAYLEGPSDG